MPLKFGSTTIENVNWEEYSGGAAMYVPIEKIIYNGTTVFEKKVLKTITENIEYTFYYVSSSSGVSFRYPTATLQLTYTPVKVTKIGGLPGGSVSQSVISSSGLSGTLYAYSSTGRSSSYKNVSWGVSGSKLTIGDGSTISGTKSSATISITYQYYG